MRAAVPPVLIVILRPLDEILPMIVPQMYSEMVPAGERVLVSWELLVSWEFHVVAKDRLPLDLHVGHLVMPI